jgi:hypothetical protein
LLNAFTLNADEAEPADSEDMLANADITLASLDAVYARKLADCAFKALILVLLLLVYVFNDAVAAFNDVICDANEALYVDDPVMLDTSVPLIVNEPVTAALCNTICYDYFV